MYYRKEVIFQMKKQSKVTSQSAEDPQFPGTGAGIPHVACAGAGASIQRAALCAGH